MEKNYKRIKWSDDRVNKRFKLIPGLGIEDTENDDDIYITLLEITGLLNRLDMELKELRK